MQPNSFSASPTSCMILLNYAKTGSESPAFQRRRPHHCQCKNRPVASPQAVDNGAKMRVNRVVFQGCQLAISIAKFQKFGIFSGPWT